MLRCKDVTRLLAAESVPEADWVVRLGVWLHLRMCKYCRRYAEQLRTIGNVARELLGGQAMGILENQELLDRLERELLRAGTGREPPG